jgi:phage-related protein (TIGR01555 family)
MAPKKTAVKLSSGPKAKPSSKRNRPLPKNDDQNYVRGIATDSYSNAPARLGDGTPNLAQAGQYPLIRLTEDYPLILSLYRSSWVIRKVIDQFAEDIYKSFPILDTELSPEQVNMFNKVVKDTATLSKLRTARKWGRLFGGAACVIVIDGHDDLMQPLNLDDINLGTYKGLIPLDRWSGIIPGPQINSNIQDPTSFGLPTYYNAIMDSGNVNIHHSRILRFTGRELPQWEVQVELYWGMSEVEIVFDELRKRDYSSWNIVSLLTRAQILSIVEPQLATLMSGAGGTNKSYNNFASRMSEISTLLNNQGLLVLGKDGHLEQTQYGFGGVSEMYHEFMKDLAAACEIPYELIFGREGGLSNTGESGLQLYYDKVDQKRTSEDGAIIDKLLPIIAMSTWGMVPDDLEYHWAPTRTMTERERMDMATVTTNTVVQAYNADLLTKKEARTELMQASKRNGFATNITQAAIEATPDKFASEIGLDQMELEQEIAGEAPGEQQEGGDQDQEAKEPPRVGDKPKGTKHELRDSAKYLTDSAPKDADSLLEWMLGKINSWRIK